MLIENHTANLQPPSHRPIPIAICIPCISSRLYTPKTLGMPCIPRNTNLSSLNLFPQTMSLSFTLFFPISSRRLLHHPCVSNSTCKMPLLFKPKHRSTLFFPFSMCAQSSTTPNETNTQTLPRGWAHCREYYLQVEGTSDRQSEDFPGVHFEQPPPITGTDLLDIIYGRTPDAWVNEILRTLLGWRQMENGEWNDDHVEPKWKNVYTKGPPNFIGKEGDYEPQHDRPVKLAVQNLTRSVPSRYKPVFRQIMRPLGFPGWKVHQLTPNLTRRAQAVNWTLYWYTTHHPDYKWSLEEQQGE